MIPQPLKAVTEDLCKVRALFVKAEGAIKKVEHVNSELVIPAVNQLRYAGNHLTRYLDGFKNLHELDAVAKHCQRAVYDAYEAAIISALLEYDKFCDDYRMVVISDIVNDYTETVTLVEDARDFLGEVKTDSREVFYKSAKPILIKYQVKSESLKAHAKS